MTPAHLAFADEAAALAYDASIAGQVPKRGAGRPRKISSEELRRCVENGLSINDVAIRYGLHCNTVYQRAAKEGLIFKSARPRLPDSEFEKCAATGMTPRETAANLGVSRHTVYLKAKRLGLTFARPEGQKKTHDQHADVMAERYRSGETLQQIATDYGITRERVRQLLKKYHGMNRRDGGVHVVSEQRKAERQAERDSRSLDRTGFSFAQLKVLRKTPGKPILRFISQRNYARHRGIPWELTLWQWWAIWQFSGKWDERGRHKKGGHSYWLVRRDRSGPFSAENVVVMRVGQ